MKVLSFAAPSVADYHDSHLCKGLEVCEDDNDNDHEFISNFQHI